MPQPWYEPMTFGRQRSENYVDITEVTKHHFFVIWIPAIVTCWMLGDCGYIVLSWTFWWMPLTPLPSKYSSLVTSARRVSRHTYRVWRNPGTQARGGTNTQGVANMQHPRINIRWEHSRIVYITVQWFEIFYLFFKKVDQVVVQFLTWQVLFYTFRRALYR